MGTVPCVCLQYTLNELSSSLPWFDEAVLYVKKPRLILMLSVNSVKEIAAICEVKAAP